MNGAKELNDEIFKIQQEFWPRKLTALSALNEVNREDRRAIEDACARAQMGYGAYDAAWNSFAGQ
jgi:hypothetical protein